MSEDVLHARIGCVPYLNARPLLAGLEGLNYRVTELVPARLFEAYQEGCFDAALLSSIDVISMPDAQVVDGVSISSWGDVYSVILAYRGDLQEITHVMLDPSSHTSNALLRIVLEEFHGIFPRYVHYKEGVSEHDVRIIIGDPAIAFRNDRHSHLGSDMRILDLGGEWYRSTGLPFVFALWSLKNNITKKKFLSESLRRAKVAGLFNLDSIADRTADPEFSRRYLCESIRYDLGDDEKKGLELFSKLLGNNNIIDDLPHKITYI